MQKVLLSHLKAYKNYPAKEEALVEWVLNPRIQLTPYRESTRILQRLRTTIYFLSSNNSRLD